MRIFISGNIPTGIFDQGTENSQAYSDTFKKFSQAEILLQEAGYTTVNPMRELTSSELLDFQGTGRLQKLENCDAIFLLDDWKTSFYSRIEFEISLKTNMKVFMEHDLFHLIGLTRYLKAEPII